MNNNGANDAAFLTTKHRKKEREKKEFRVSNSQKKTAIKKKSETLPQLGTNPPTV